MPNTTERNECLISIEVKESLTVGSNEQPMASSGGAGTGFARPSTDGQRRNKIYQKKEQVVKITD